MISKFNKDDVDALYAETGGLEMKEKEMKVLDMFTEVGLTSSNGDAKKNDSIGIFIYK
jgi:hypothetical protein